MLIIAQPKSASTSLMHGLAKILGVSSIQDKCLRKKFKIDSEYEILPHSDMAHIPYNLISKWVNSENVYKQHLTPNDVHFNILSSLNAKCVVLLRDPLEVLFAYTRSHKSLSNVLLPQNRRIVMDQLDTYYYKCLSIFSNNKNYLMITFQDLTSNESGTTNQILGFIGSNRRVGKNYKLPKYRYTRRSI